ncbi:hypothetical protein CIW48_08150 [Methylobacterium sp. P1-11]|uniref:hypothetical protein n=1 Tax=Methylobacterium sp. P1-11 TaxID=2024616 RepID=UPI0011EDF2DF|nr:hypothetical protein [Methylobacterium sp. P1-11]KAA0124289.1 hypothetical protein CIW48_08150 [Methylobacterium sp. P1-11]
MTLLFPRASSVELERYVVPFGRMMLAYGRAHEAVVELVLLEITEEAEAREHVAGTKGLPKKMRRLFRDKLGKEEFELMNVCIKQFSEVASERHHLIHGEWWFDGKCLVVRRLHKGLLMHALDITPARIDEWGETLDNIADELDIIQDTARRKREAAEF